MSFKRALFLASCLGAPLFGNLKVEVDLLYCQALLDDLAYAASVGSHVSPPFMVDATLDERRPEYSWDPGIRVAVGTDYFDSCYEVSVVGTYLHSKATSEESGSLEDITHLLQPLWFQTLSGVRSTFAAASWKLDFATLDLVTSRTFFPCGWLLISPQVGFRGVLIRQRYDIDYVNNIFIPAAAPPIAFPLATADLTSRYLAGGILLGTCVSIPLFERFSFDAGVAGSLVYGQTRVREDIFGMIAVSETDLISINIHLPTKKCQLRANVEATAALSYKTCVRRHALEVSLGYLFSLWFDQNDFYNLNFTAPSGNFVTFSDNFIMRDRKRGNLQIQGVTLGATLHF